MLSCREITELATAYTERALPFTERIRFWVHLSMCKHCRRYVKQLRLTIDATGQVMFPLPKPSPQTQAALLRTFQNWKKGPGKPPSP
ncbi:MAG: zf-HC2 domain-containing protein [Myxococcaceae bacterium]|nr:zf-HC2 domain-containing protein [Myxococcaceae bacterium]